MCFLNLRLYNTIIYMLNIKLIVYLLVFVIAVKSELRTDAPVRVLKRKISIATFMKNFQNVICTQCGTQSKYCADNLKRISEMPQTNYFKPESLRNNIYNITGADVTIDSVRVSCSFPNKNLINKQMDYVIYLPISTTKILEGVIIYFHSTLYGVRQVPASGSDQINSIAGLYTANGYAVVFIDYLGYQNTDHFPHPYLQYPQCDVQSAVLALNSALKKLRNSFPDVKKFKLFTVGYSQGGAYALWFEKCLSNPQNCGNVNLDDAYQFHATAAMDGPYDLQKTVIPFLTSQVQKLSQKSNIYHIQNQNTTNFNKPPLLAMTLISYMYYSLGKTNYSQKMNKQFWKMQCTSKSVSVSNQQKCKVNGIQYADIYRAMKSQQESQNIAESIANSAFGKKYNTPSVQYLGESRSVHERLSYNSVYGLAQKQLMTSQHFNETIRNASAINNIPQHNVFLFSLKRDSIFSPKNTLDYYNTHKNTGKVQMFLFDNSLFQICELDSHTHSNVDHNYGQLLANIFALSFIKRNI